MRACGLTPSRSADSQQGLFIRHPDSNRRTHRHPVVVPRQRQRSLGGEISQIYSTDFAGDSA